MPLEISPWCFARILVPGKELSRAELCSLQQGSILLPVQTWHSASTAPVVPAAVRWGRHNLQGLCFPRNTQYRESFREDEWISYLPRCTGCTLGLRC